MPLKSIFKKEELQCNGMAPFSPFQSLEILKLFCLFTFLQKKKLKMERLILTWNRESCALQP